MAYDLAGLLARGENGQLKLAVAGDYGPKTRQVLSDALKLNEGKKLTGLELLFIGPAEYRSTIQEATERLGATFHYRPMP
jgi:hypothetical protein